MLEAKSIPNPIVTSDDFTLWNPNHKFFLVPTFSDPQHKWKFVAPEKFQKFHEQLKDFECFEDDVFIIGHPKTGTTWAQEMVWLITHNLDFDTAKRVMMTDRVNYIDGSGFLNWVETSIEDGRTMTRPRCFKSHLLPEVLPGQVWTKNSKIVYITRNPMDTAVSFYHFNVHVFDYKGTLEQFMDAFIAGHTIYGPFFENIESYLSVQDRPNVLFISYEEMKRDLRKVLQKVSGFLGKSYSEDDFDTLETYLSLENMRNTPTSSYEAPVRELLQALKKNKTDEEYRFIRKGEIGTFKEELSAECIKKFEDWTNENLKRLNGFSFNL